MTATIHPFPADHIARPPMGRPASYCGISVRLLCVGGPNALVSYNGKTGWVSSGAVKLDDLSNVERAYEGLPCDVN